MAQQPQQQQVIYLVMDENNQGQQIQFIDGQPTLVMSPEAGLLGGTGGLTASDSDSQVLLVSEDGQLVTGNEGQVVVDEQGQVVMTTDEGQQVALETETLNVSSEQQGHIQYVLTSDSLASHTTSKGNILSQAGSIITGSQTSTKETNGAASKDEDGYTTIVIGGSSVAGEIQDNYKNIYLESKGDGTTVVNSLGQQKMVSHQSHPILSHQLNITQSPSKPPVRAPGDSPRSKPAMVSILNKARLASLQQQQSSAQAAVAEAPSTQPVTHIVVEQDPAVCQAESMQVDQTPVMEDAQQSIVDNAATNADTNGQGSGVDSQDGEQMIHIENIPISDEAEAPEDQSSLLPADAITDSVPTDELNRTEQTAVALEQTGVGFEQNATDLGKAAVDVEQTASSLEETPEDVPDGAQLQIQEDHGLEAGTEAMETEQSKDADKAPVATDNVTGIGNITSSLDEYMTRQPVSPSEEPAPQEVPAEAASELTPMSDQEDVEEPAPALVGDVGMGTMLGPFRCDSDESGPEADGFDDNPLTIDTSPARSEKVPKPLTKRQKGESRSSVDDKGGSESDTNRRRSSRVKSPKRYSEEPIIFGEDFSKPHEPRPQVPKDDTPKKKGRPPKKRPYYVYEEIDTSESEGVAQSEEEEPAIKLATVGDESKLKFKPPKKRISHTASSAESSEDTQKEPVQVESPKKRGRPPKKRFLDQHNSSQEEDNAEKAKKEEEKKEETKPRKRSIEKKTVPVLKTWSLRRSTSEQKAESVSTESEVLSKVAGKKLIVEDKEIEDNFGFGEESEKEEENKTSDTTAKSTDTILVQKKTDAPIITVVQKNVTAPPEVPASVTKVILSPETAAQVKVTVSPTKSKIIDTTPVSPPKTKPTESAVETKAKDETVVTKKMQEAKTPSKPVDKASTPSSEPKKTPKYNADTKPKVAAAERSMGTTTTGDRTLGINFKSMKFSVSKRLSGSTTPEQKKIFTSSVRKSSPPVVRTPVVKVGIAEKDIQSRETAVAKREQKARNLDIELEERASQLKVKEAKLDRLERKLKETEKNLEYRERRIKREEQNLDTDKDTPPKTPKESGRMSRGGEVETSDDKAKYLKILEKKLAAKEKELNQKEEQLKKDTADLEQKKALLATTEQQLTALSQELSEKYAYLQDKGETSGTKERPGLFEKIASLSKANLLQKPKEDSKREREVEEPAEEESEPPRKKSRRSSTVESTAPKEEKGRKKRALKPSLVNLLSKNRKDKAQEKEEKMSAATKTPGKAVVKKQPSMLKRLALHGKPGIKTRVPRLPKEPATDTKVTMTRTKPATPTTTKKAATQKGKETSPLRGKVTPTPKGKATPTQKGKATPTSMSKATLLPKSKTTSSSSLRSTKSASRLPRSISVSSQGKANVKKDTPKGKGKKLAPSKGSKSSIRSSGKATPKGRKK